MLFLIFYISPKFWSTEQNHEWMTSIKAIIIYLGDAYLAGEEGKKATQVGRLGVLEINCFWLKEKYPKMWEFEIPSD